jgi:lysophospholipase
LGTFTFHALFTPDKIPLRAAVREANGAARGTCVLLPGLTEFIEKYEEVAGELAARGFRVAIIDWRGQGASERTAPGNRAIHVRDFEAYDLDLITLMRELVPAGGGGPVIALANSMGAHILLRHLRDNSRRFACAVMMAPMLAINTQPYPAWLTRIVTALCNLRRPSKRLVPGWEADPMTLSFEKQRVTRDRARWERTQALLRAQPFLRTFGPSFGWLGAAFRSIREIARRGFAEDIATPVLIVGAGADKIVLTAPQADYARRLVKGSYVGIADAEHEILMERDEIRAQFWKAFDEFVEKHVVIGLTHE